VICESHCLGSLKEGAGHAWTEITHAQDTRVLRLRAGGMSKRKIAASLSIGITAAGDCIRRANRAGLSWPLPEDLSDATLERLVYPRSSRPGSGRVSRPAAPRPNGPCRRTALASPWMERIEDQNLDRRTPGSVTLSRPASASRGCPVRSPRRRAGTATPVRRSGTRPW
jgi:hypothetical protein